MIKKIVVEKYKCGSLLLVKKHDGGMGHKVGESHEPIGEEVEIFEGGKEQALEYCQQKFPGVEIEFRSDAKKCCRHK